MSGGNCRRANETFTATLPTKNTSAAVGVDNAARDKRNEVI